MYGLYQQRRFKCPGLLGLRRNKQDTLTSRVNIPDLTLDVMRNCSTLSKDSVCIYYLTDKGVKRGSSNHKEPECITLNQMNIGTFSRTPEKLVTDRTEFVWTVASAIISC